MYIYIYIYISICIYNEFICTVWFALTYCNKFKPFHASSLLLNPLKTTENQRF